MRGNLIFEVSRFWATIILIGFCATTATAQRGGAPQMAPVDPHDLSGYWLLTIDGRKVPPSVLQPTVTKAMIQQHLDKDVHAIRWCNLLGTPFVMDPGVPIDIRVGTREMIIDTPTPADPRHIYFRPAHTSEDVLDPSTNGDSIAHWDGDTLIVDTIGFSPTRGITAIPGGGYKTATTHLVEEFKLLNNGATLSVKSTWTDPKMFKTSHTYEYRYTRLAKTYEPTIGFACNPYDQARADFLGDPAPFKEETSASKATVSKRKTP